MALFQQGEIPVFLISLKAGGTGLNLTAADTVIHYDPWWNPVVEAQATGRAHRMGQQNPVFVYKLVCAGTVEERILDLQARKADLAASILKAASNAAATVLCSTRRTWRCCSPRWRSQLSQTAVHHYTSYWCEA
ncbi:SWF/SNF helicase family protein [Halomonas sp. G15]|uniref:helicase-related protein n=1 Tax=Halomonas sp. G15 TaxID=2903521 RepID=UPI001E4B6367|nr:SWF/SNF helicase family protein [Halomonas sp. G15]